MMSVTTIESRYSPHFGKKFNHLTFLRLDGKKGDNRRVYGVFECKCGEEVISPVGRVMSGYKDHCGCMANRTPNLIHGMRNTGAYSSWQSAKNRATCPSSKDYHRYGAAGIGMCERWMDFNNFFEDMGERPDGYSIDRIDCNKGYEPGNCRWATRDEQGRNRRSGYIWNIKGKTFDSLYIAAEHFGVSGQTVWRWVNGSFDSRRNSFTAPRRDCHAKKQY